MASPSAPVWVVTAPFSRPFKKSAISRVVLFLALVRIFSRLFDVFECCFYPAHVLYDRVWFEMKPRRALEARLGPDHGLDTSRRALQSLSGAFYVLAREDAVEDRGMSKIRAHPDARNRDEALNAWVRESPDLLADYLLQLRLDFTSTSAH